MKTENREKEDAGSMEAWSHAQYPGERERGPGMDALKELLQVHD